MTAGRKATSPATEAGHPAVPPRERLADGPTDLPCPAPGDCAADRDRAAAVETIHRELTVFARRARAAAGRMHPQLSLVAYTLLSHLQERDGCRATDLAVHYALDKSTVSRQVAALERDGLVRRRVDPDDHRGQVLDLTARGTGVLAEVKESRRTAFQARLAGWPPADLARFAEFLRRYNEAAADPAADPARDAHEPPTTPPGH